ncbi:hypothetical protein cypCar_00031385, partial [Cyprinus carpio]
MDGVGPPLTSDAGMGCMLRSAHDAARSRLIAAHDARGESRRDSGKPRRCSLGTTIDCETQEEQTHRRIVSWFGDLSSAPFGSCTG